MEKNEKQSKIAKNEKVGVKDVQFVVGLNGMGSRLSVQADKTMELEMTGIGIKMTSHKTGRVIVVPYTNVKGFELFPETEAA